MAITSTATTMYARIRQIVDREDVAYFSNTQLSGFVEMAVDEFLQQYYNVYETSQDARDKLAKAVIHYDSTTHHDGNPIDIDTLSGYGRLLSLRRTSDNTKIKIVQVADLTSYYNDPFNKADLENPIAWVQDNKINLLGIGTSPVALILVALQYSVSYTYLDSHTYEEIAQIAARRILATLGDPRYQFLQAELMERLIQGGGK